jgi:aminopeptidase
MKDIRITKWADTLINFSLEAKKGQYAVIVGDIEGLPLIEACYEELIKKGVFVDVCISPRYFSEILLQNAPKDVLSTTSPAMQHAVSQCDLYLVIGSETNTKLLSNMDREKQALVSRARLPILESVMTRSAANELRWCYTHFPTPAAAQEADMGNREYEEFIYSLGYLNDKNPILKWKKLEKEQQKLIQYLEIKKMLHFTNQQGTDLKVDVSHMKWVNCCGKINFPDGEVYTGPNLKAENGGVNGIVRYSFPVLYRNVEVCDIELIFEKGAVVEARASKGQEFLRAMISQDPGAKFVGEIAIGTNSNMNRITKNILYDEKFGGTFHLALGKGYPETGNTNQSALHWDITFDLRNQGKIYADNELFYQNGKFLPQFGFGLLE